MDLIIKNQKDLIIKKITLEDSISSILIDGRIVDLTSPIGDLSAEITTSLEKLKNYNFLRLPDDLSLKGSPKINLKVKGDLLKYQNLNLPFKIQAENIAVNQFDIASPIIEGTFKQMKLDISSLSLKLYEGELTAKASVDLADMKNPGFNLNTLLSEVDIAEFAARTNVVLIGTTGTAAKQQLTQPRLGRQVQRCHPKMIRAVRSGPRGEKHSNVLRVGLLGGAMQRRIVDVTLTGCTRTSSQ